MATIRFAALLRSPTIPCVLVLNAASQMVGSQKSEISTDGRTTAVVGDLQMYKIPLVYFFVCRHKGTIYQQGGQVQKSSFIM